MFEGGSSESDLSDALKGRQQDCASNSTAR